jgi:hypothetical protein
MATTCSLRLGCTTNQNQEKHAMAKTNVDLPLPCGNPLLPVPSVLLAELIGEADELGSRFPEVHAAIEADQDRAGMAKKQLRCEQQAWQARRTTALPGLESAVGEPVEATGLHGGRPRMPPMRFWLSW